MNKLAKKFLSENDSYISALEQAIDGWKKAGDERAKRDHILAVGDIGAEIRRMNRTLDISHMDC